MAIVLSRHPSLDPTISKAWPWELGNTQSSHAKQQALSMTLSIRDYSSHTERFGQQPIPISYLPVNKMMMQWVTWCCHSVKCAPPSHQVNNVPSQWIYITDFNKSSFTGHLRPMGIPTTLRKHSTTLPLIAEACQPTASIRSISLPHTLCLAPHPCRSE